MYKATHHEVPDTARGTGKTLRLAIPSSHRSPGGLPGTGPSRASCLAHDRNPPRIATTGVDWASFCTRARRPRLPLVTCRGVLAHGRGGVAASSVLMVCRPPPPLGCPEAVCVPIPGRSQAPMRQERITSPERLLSAAAAIRGAPVWPRRGSNVSTVFSPLPRSDRRASCPE